MGLLAGCRSLKIGSETGGFLLDSNIGGPANEEEGMLYVDDLWRVL